MRLIKMFGLASIMAVTAIAIVGASSASASGVLCEKNEKVCPEESIVNHWIWNTPGVWRWRNTLLCLNQITLWAYDPWTGLYASYLTYSNCGTTIAHNNCSVRLAGGRAGEPAAVHLAEQGKKKNRKSNLRLPAKTKAPWKC